MLSSFLYVPIWASQTLKRAGILLIYVNWFFFNRVHNKTTTAQKQKPEFIGISSRTETLLKAEVTGEQLPGIIAWRFLSARKPVKCTERWAVERGAGSRRVWPGDGCQLCRGMSSQALILEQRLYRSPNKSSGSGTILGCFAASDPGICHEKRSGLPAVWELRCLINDEKALCERLQLSVRQHLEKMEQQWNKKKKPQMVLSGESFPAKSVYRGRVLEACRSPLSSWSRPARCACKEVCAWACVSVAVCTLWEVPASSHDISFSAGFSLLRSAKEDD